MSRTPMNGIHQIGRLVRSDRASHLETLWAFLTSGVPMRLHSLEGR